MLKLFKIFDLRKSTDFKGTDEYIRNSIHFRQENAWALICSIIIASVGLNVNSTAVIIGAMLISPLMGPIIGAGYSLAIEDLNLFKESMKSFSTSVLISLVTSTLFFTLSPFTQAQSELLSRTQPTIYDLLIATFGGIVGIVALTRVEKGNVIPGVAIATALMPPLCTVGYGVSQLDYRFFLGAGYLFTINVFFIALSTFVIVRFLDFRLRLYGKDYQQGKVKIWVYVLVAIISLPSVGVAWYLKQKTSFQSKVEKFVQVEFLDNNILISRKIEKFELKNSSLKLYTLGKVITDDLKHDFSKKLKPYGLENVHLEIYDVISLSQKDKKLLTSEKKSEADVIKIELENKSEELSRIKENEERQKKYEKEVKVINKKVTSLILHIDPEVSIANVLSAKLLYTNEKKLITEFLNTKMKIKVNYYREQ